MTAARPPAPGAASDLDPVDAPGPSEGLPAVVAVVVTHDPGPWFDETLRSLAAQTYPSLSVLVIDAASEIDPAPRVAAVLPQARIRRLDRDEGYGASANAVLGAVEGAGFHLLCHDDVALAPDAVRNLVEEAFRTNAGVLGPKLVEWDDPRRILSVGGSVDKAGVPAPHAEAGELDQEQHDAVRDVFYVAGGATLVRADLFETIGGFDPAITFSGDDVDLCWRAHVAGARVVTVPAAVVRHRQALAERRPDLPRRRLAHRHRLRSVLGSYSLTHLVRVLPQALVLTVVEALAALVSGRFRHAAEALGAWSWNLRQLRSLRRRRRTLARSRTVRDREVRDLQVRGSARFTAFLRGQVGPADDRLIALAATGRGLSTALRAPLTRVTLGAAGVALVIMALGSRGLVLEPIPAVGELSAAPSSALDVLGDHLSGWRATAGGGEAPSPTGNGAAGLAGLLALGSMGAARKLLILGLLPAGPLAIWRLTRPIGSIRAAAAAVVVYAAIPVPYNALASGSWPALVAYAVMPWVVLGLARATGLAPFGRRDLPDTTEVRSDGSSNAVPARALGIGLALALGALISPALVPLTGLVTAGLVIGSLVAGRVQGLGRLLAAAVGGVVVGAALHLPWSASLLTRGGGWDAVIGATDAPAREVGELLRFQTGPFGNSPIGWAFLAAAALPLIIGRGWRLAWAIRAWFVALAAWGLLVADGQGWIPFGLPAPEMVLVPASIGLALSAALGMAAFEVDLRQYRFGWRQGASLVAALSVVVGSFTLAPGVVDGRWRLPEGDLNRTMAPVLAGDGDERARILWLGDLSVLPLGAHRITDDVALATSDGLPDIRHHWAGARHRSTDRLASLVEVAADRRTARLGGLLGPEGVRYIVVPTRTAPEAFRGAEVPPPAWLTDALDSQLDLEQVPTDRSLIVYRNTAWTGMAATVAPGAVLPDDPEGAVASGAPERQGPITRGALSASGYRIESPGGAPIVAAVPAESGWRLDIDGVTGADGEAYGWAAVFSEPEAGRGDLRHETPLPARAAVIAQPLLWLLVLALRGRLSRRARDRAERERAEAEAAARREPDDDDPVTAAAEAVAAHATEGDDR